MCSEVFIAHGSGTYDMRVQHSKSGDAYSGVKIDDRIGLSACARHDGGSAGPL